MQVTVRPDDYVIFSVKGHTQKKIGRVVFVRKEVDKKLGRTYVEIGMVKPV